MAFLESAFQKTGELLRFRYDEPRLVEPGETPGSTMNPRVFAAEAEERTLEDLSSNAFLSDVAAMRHETLEPRLFQS